MQPVSCENTPNRGRRDPHPPKVGTAVRKLAVAAVDLAPLVEQRDDLVLFLGQQPMHRLTARSAIRKLITGTTIHPPPHPVLLDVQHPARLTDRHARLEGLVDQLKQARLRGRINTSGDPAT